jgi:hypothetical protein
VIAVLDSMDGVASRGRFSSACLIQAPRLCKFVLIEAIDNSYVSQIKVPVCRTNLAEKAEFCYSSFTVKNQEKLL